MLYNYDYLLNTTELDHNLFNINTSLIFAYYCYMILISKCKLFDSLILMFAFNIYFVYHNYTRKYLSNNHPLFYYCFYFLYFGLIIYRLHSFSTFGFVFMIYLCCLFWIVFPLLVTLGDRFRARWDGPFSLPEVKDYSFEIYHVLLNRINSLI